MYHILFQFHQEVQGPSGRKIVSNSRCSQQSLRIAILFRFVLISPLITRNNLSFKHKSKTSFWLTEDLPLKSRRAFHLLHFQWNMWLCSLTPTQVSTTPGQAQPPQSEKTATNKGRTERNTKGFCIFTLNFLMRYTEKNRSDQILDSLKGTHRCLDGQERPGNTFCACRRHSLFLSYLAKNTTKVSQNNVLSRL